MASSDWRSVLSMTDRYDNIQKLRKHFEQAGAASKGEAQKAAFTAETEIFKISESLEAYESTCNSFVVDTVIEVPDLQDPSMGSYTIGSYQDCHHISSGLVSEVYQSATFALKVVTQTHNVEPHNVSREVQILRQLCHDSIIKLVETIKDEHGRPVLIFPFMPLTFAGYLGSKDFQSMQATRLMKDMFSALAYLHEQGIIHRDVKPSNILLAGATGPAYLADFGTAWHPSLSFSDEPADHKYLEVGTTCYRAPETLFGNRNYNSSLDMWAAGALFAECCRTPPAPLFHSPATDEDGNQLALILSIFKTLGTPTEETWPEAKNFPTPPFEWYNMFPAKPLEALLPDAGEAARDLVRRLVCYESGDRLTAAEILSSTYFENLP